MTKKLFLDSGAKTEKRDMFAKFLAKGYNQKDAFIKAGFAPKNAIVEASRMKGELDVVKAYNYYLAIEMKPFNISSKSIVAKIASMASVNLKDFINPKNGELLSPKDLPKHVLEGVKDYKRIITKEGNTIHEYKFHDKFLALDKLKEYKVALLEMERQVKENNKSSEDANKVHLKINGLNIPIKKQSDLSKPEEQENKKED